MKTPFWILAALALLGVQAFGQPILRQATDAEVAAGTDVHAYVNPKQAQSIGGTTNGQTAAQVGAAIKSTNDNFVVYRLNSGSTNQLIYEGTAMNLSAKSNAASAGVAFNAQGIVSGEKFSGTNYHFSGTNNILISSTNPGVNIIIGRNVAPSFLNGGGQWNIFQGESTAELFTNGSRNLALGDDAFRGAEYGSFNTSLGNSSLTEGAVDWYDTAVGFSALDNVASGTNSSDDFENPIYTNNVALGAFAGTLLQHGQNNIYIGSYGPPSRAEDGTIHIGNPGMHTSTVIAGAVTADGSGVTNLLHSSTVSAGANTTVTPSKNPDGSTNYQVAASSPGGSQTPWTSDIDAAGHNLSNVGSITANSASVVTMTATNVAGNGFGFTNLNVWDLPTNTWSGSQFILGTNKWISSASNIYFISCTNVPSAGIERNGQLTIVATADLLVTNPVNWHANDYTNARWISNGWTAAISLDVQTSCFSNLFVVPCR